MEGTEAQFSGKQIGVEADQTHAYLSPDRWLQRDARDLALRSSSS
jgi:hypothetical protein